MIKIRKLASVKKVYPIILQKILQDIEWKKSFYRFIKQVYCLKGRKVYELIPWKYWTQEKNMEKYHKRIFIQTKE